MRRLLLALGIPCLIMLALQWRLVSNLIRVSLFPDSLRQANSLALTQDTSQEDRLIIPQLGVQAPIVKSSTDPRLIADWSRIKEDLRQGVSLAEKLALPGQPGTTVITGHSSDIVPHRYSAIFATLNHLKPNDSIELRYNGQTYKYKVKETRIVEANDSIFETKSLHSGEGNRLLLVTCWPLLTTNKRLVAIADPAR